MARFTVDGIEYRSGLMPARTQAHVLRRLAPILDPVFRIMGSKSKGDPDDEAVGALATGFGTLSDENMDYVFDKCLAVVERKNGEAWARFTTPDGKSTMYEDVDLSGQVQIISHVLRENYTPLFLKARSLLSDAGNP